MRIYNLCKGKNVNCGSGYSHRLGEHSMALVHISLIQMSMNSGLLKYKHEVHAAVKN